MATAWVPVDLAEEVDSADGAELMTHRSCPVCGSDRERMLLELGDFQFHTDSPGGANRVRVRTVECLNCSGHYLNPCYTLAGMSTLFAEADQSYGASEGRPDEEVEWLRTRGLLERGSTLLDVGCHEGRLLGAMPSHVNRIGVDLDREAVARGMALRGSDGVQLVVGEFETFEVPARPDTITMFHVLEHLARPVEVLRKLRAVSKSDCRLVVEVPIVENGATNDLVGFFTAYHLTHFGRGSLAGALARAGWSVVEWFEHPEYNGCRVLAEPSPEAERIDAASRREPAAANHCLAAWYQAAADADGRLADWSDAETCVIWGAGSHTEYLFHRTSFFHSAPSRGYLIVDSDASKHGRTWRGVPVASPDVLGGIDMHEVPLVVSSYQHQDEMARAAMELGVPEPNIVKLYDHVEVH